MSEQAIQQAERRREPRVERSGAVRASRAMPFLPLSDATVLNVSPSGIAIRTSVPLHIGDRLSFQPGRDLPPVLAEVLGCEVLDDQTFRVRCRALLGNFQS